MSDSKHMEKQTEQKIAVVTGASGGMGLATAVQLAATGMKVFLLARNKEKGEAAIAEVNRRSGRSDAELVLCDLASLAQIRAAAADLEARCDRIDVLINNAGVVTTKREVTEDGFERQLGVNHLGHFALTNLLLPLLRKSAAARIVIVSSGAHKIGRMHYEDPGMTKGFTIWGAYGRSKLANIWFMKALDTRMKGTTMTVNAVHPGAVSTQIGVNRRTGFGTLVHKLLRPFFLTPERGADTAVYLATSKEVQGVSGQYFYRRMPAAISERASSAEQAERFWAWSEQVTGIHSEQ